MFIRMSERASTSASVVEPLANSSLRSTQPVAHLLGWAMAPQPAQVGTTSRLGGSAHDDTGRSQPSNPESVRQRDGGSGVRVSRRNVQSRKDAARVSMRGIYDDQMIDGVLDHQPGCLID